MSRTISAQEDLRRMTAKEARALLAKMFASGNVLEARIMRREKGMARLGRSGRAIPQYTYEIHAIDRATGLAFVAVSASLLIVSLGETQHICRRTKAALPS